MHGREFGDIHFDRGTAGASIPSRTASTGLLVARKIKVRFIDEPGEGNGVMRSYFTTIADCLLSQEPLPSMDLEVKGNVNEN